MADLKAVVLPVEGRPTIRHLDRADDSALHALQEIVGGTIQAVGDQHATMFLNDEGKLMGLPPNPAATRLARAMEWIFVTDYIAGDVVLTGGTDAEGETMDVPESLVLEVILP